MVKVKLLALEPELQLYVSPINFHPDCHPVAFSWPPDHASELAKEFGLFKTLGWALDTWTSSSDIVDESLFLEDMDATVGQYEKMMEGMLARDDWDVYVQIFYFTDRIGHLLWRYFDETHPRYDPAKAEFYQQQMLLAYRRMDTIVGKAMAALDDDVELIVLSDHGFSSFSRGVNYNTWLVNQGLMTLKGDTSRVSVAQLFDSAGDLFVNVDWSRTKAYALGLGGIYVNLAGRESGGIVMPGPEYEEVRTQIIEGLEALVDEERSQHPVTKVYTREEMYGEFDAALVPDLRVANALGYRVSWQTTLGGFGSQVVEDNSRTWSGDHCSNDPELVRGIFFSSRPITEENPRMVDVMPSLMQLLGLDPPAEIDGHSLYESLTP